jgi:ABC-2 type transport system permease protein
MSTAALDHPDARYGDPSSRYGLRHVLRAELVKLTTLRSTWVTLTVTLLGALGVTVLVCASAGHHQAGWYQGFDPTNQSLIGLAIGTLALGVLGVMAATGEYATGTIRSTLAAAPRRPLLLLGKVLVVAAAALAVGEVLSFGCFWLGQAVLHGGGAPTAAIAQPGVLRAVLLSGAFLALLGLLGLGLGVIVRHTAGAIGTYVAVTFLIPLLISRLPSQPARFTPLPMLASSVSAVVPNNGGAQVSVPEAMVLMTIYSAAVLVIAAAMIARRDA